MMKEKYTQSLQLRYRFIQTKACRIVTLGGRGFDDWVDLIETIEEWAKEMGCNSVEMFCRKGFIKKLGSRGYGEIYTVLGKELTTLH